MNYNNTELQHALAARFVVGSMRGQARRKFIRLQMRYPKLREEVIFWEQHLNELTEQLPVQAAPTSAWANIQLRLGWLPIKSSATWWSWLSTAVAAVLLVVVVNQTLLTEPVPEVPITERIAVVQNSEARTLWLIEQRAEQLYVNATPNVDTLTNEDYQLWMLPSSGAAPISLGLLPQQGQRTLDVPANLDLSQVAALAVSREPLGGSPEAVPTGPVIFTTDLLNATQTQT